MSGKTFLQIAFSLLIALAFLLMGLSPVQAQAPSNDNFTGATPINTTPYEDQVDVMTEATLEEGEPIPSCSWEYFTPDHTVWYAYTPGTRGLAYIHISPGNEFFLAVYTGSDLVDLTEIGCIREVWDASFDVQAGQTYYLQIGSMWNISGWMHLQLDLISPPPNDNFADATDISLGASISVDNSAASVEPGEPSPSCESAIRTVWFLYTPENSDLVTAQPSERWNVVAVYTGSELGNLLEVGCRAYGNPLPLRLERGITYYFQVASKCLWWCSGEFTFQLYETPMPTADFGWSPGDPNIYDNVEFCDWSDDPVNIGFSDYSWDFGDGVSMTGNCVYHQFAADGDYTIWHNVQTNDGRTDPDGVTKTITVRTHDVAINRVAAPKSANVGQTRQITVYIKNIRYPERVEVQLYKSVMGGFEMAGVTNQIIPVRGGNRTTPVSFYYTFTQGDAEMGKVTFKVVVNLLEGARDALPADNEAISPPTKIQ